MNILPTKKENKGNIFFKNILTYFEEKINETKEEKIMISNYLKNYFKEKKISHYEIERKTGISQSKVNLSLNGKRRLTAEELLKISIEFDIDLNQLKKILRAPTK